MPAVTICNQNQISCTNLLQNVVDCQNTTNAPEICSLQENNATLNYIYDNFCNVSSGATSIPNPSNKMFQ